MFLGIGPAVPSRAQSEQALNHHQHPHSSPTLVRRYAAEANKGVNINYAAEWKWYAQRFFYVVLRLFIFELSSDVIFTPGKFENFNFSQDKHTKKT